MAIISASRRTDIPAFYGEWFMQRVKAGECLVTHPFTGKKSPVSLRLADVEGVVFWSKNYIPFTSNLAQLHEAGYRFYLNYSLNNYESTLEPLHNFNREIVDNLLYLSTLYPIFWRYDPIYISEKTDLEFHLKNFAYLCGKFKGRVNRVIINFIQEYPRVMGRISDCAPYSYISISNEEKAAFALKLKEIAEAHSIPIYCCTDFLQKEGIIAKSHCVDQELLIELTRKPIKLKLTHTFKGCNCYKSTDIGSYNSCPNKCLYCYANSKHQNIKSIATFHSQQQVDG